MIESIRVPDLGTDSADVIELLVQVGQSVAVDTPLVLLESAKASMEVPSPRAGVVRGWRVQQGDKVSEGAVLLELDTADSEAPVYQLAEEEPAVVVAAPVSAPVAVDTPAVPTQTTAIRTVLVPDLGTDSADVIEILVQVGQSVAVDTPLVLLESAKASMEVPSPAAGVVQELLVQTGSKVSEGVRLLVLATAEQVSPVPASPSMPTPPVPTVRTEPAPVPASSLPVVTAAAVPAPATPPAASLALLHCGPAVRRLARELGADLYQVQATGPKGRILKEDVHAWVKSRLTAPPPAPVVVAAAVTTSAGLPELPEIDFAKWGEVERLPLTRIQKVSAQNLHRAWLHIPHVTQFDEADITELEAFRVAQKDALKKQGINLTLLAFLVRVCARALRQFPRFNASLARDGETLILKKYVHIGVAVDTPNGLVVPVIRDADRKSVSEIARELGELSARARDKKLLPAEMQGACFSISSLGGIGGTAFTPIVNWPEVAILGVSRSSLKPVWNGSAFVPRLQLPLSLSYDHRVIDGAEAARFTTVLAALLADIRTLLL